MFVIAGLGNPGLQYRKTRHNIGFMAIDTLAKELKISIKTKAFGGLVGEGELNGQRVLLVKPQTYMNLSGDCLQAIMHFYKLPPRQLIVLVDDVALPLGSLRIRSKGSAGSHNGLKSIIACLNSQDFPRIRIGCGQDESLLLRDYVLKRPPKQELKALEDSYRQVQDALSLIVEGKIEQAQGQFNKKHEGSKSKEV